MTEILIGLTILLPWLGAVIVWLIGDQFEKVQHVIAVIFSILAAVSALLLLGEVSSGTAISISIGSTFGDYSFVPDGLGVFLAIVATLIGSLAVIFSVDYMHGEKQLGRYYAMVLFFIGAMVGLVLTSNMMLMFVFWEITALCSYVLISFYNDDQKAYRGGMKALIITQVGGLGLLFGSILLIGYTGSFDINAFLANPSVLPGNILALMSFGFLIAAAAKSAQFPFQTWLPDAMEAPTPISALIHAATMVNAGVYLLARFFPAFEGVPGWKMSVMVVGMISALLAAIMAVVANDLKRVLAYSTVSQLGYMVYAVGAGGFFASQFHLLSHSVFKALLFLSAGAIIHSIGTRDMRLMGDLSKKLPFVKVVFIIGSLALAGIPILNGFWSKELILEVGLENGNPIWIYIVMLFVAGLTALYTFRCLWMVFYAPAVEEQHVHQVGKAMKVALIPLTIGSLSTWLLVGLFSKMLKTSLPAHEIHELSIFKMMKEIVTTPATWIALAIIGLGIMTWFSRDSIRSITKIFNRIGIFAENSFGFEAINNAIETGIKTMAEKLRVIQTGQLSWNIFGIVTGLVVVIAVLVIGAK